MRPQVQRYNALLWRTFIDIPTREEPVIEQPYWDKKAREMKIRRVKLSQDNKFVRRVFYRDDWNLGGRFHGGCSIMIKDLCGHCIKIIFLCCLLLVNNALAYTFEETKSAAKI